MSMRVAQAGLLCAMSIVSVVAMAERARAGVPDPANCTVTVGQMPSPCQFRFRPEGGLDRLTTRVVLRDSLGDLVPNWALRGSIVSSGAPSVALCSCCPDQHTSSDLAGNAMFIFQNIGGRGELSIRIESDTPLFEIDTITVPFTTPDLTGSESGPNPNPVPPCHVTIDPLKCDGLPHNTNVADLGIWALIGLPPAPYSRLADFNCSGNINVVDLGVWAGSLCKECVVAGVPCP